MTLTADQIFQAKADPHGFVRLGDGHYRLDVPECATSFDLDRLFRDRHELCGELVVLCQIKGARTFAGNLFSGNVNVSSAYRRRDVASRLRERAKTADTVDWDGLLDELAARVVKAERDGQPPRLLSTFDRPAPDDVFSIEGLTIPRRHPSIWFGDGGVFKSYLALFAAGWLAQQSIRVLYADWEMEGPDHRLRLEQLFGEQTMPALYYARYHRPLVEEADGIKRFIEKERIEFVVCDSVGFATNGAPESAEAAMAYFRAVRTLGQGVGSLHLAHVTKQSEGAPDPVRPFGSTFWHNSARSTWFIKRTADEGNRFAIALFNRKSNLGALRPPVGLEIAFGADRIDLRHVDVADVAEFSANLPMSLRVTRALKAGSKTIAELEEATGGKPDTVKKTLSRGRGKAFVCITNTPDGVHRWGLVERRAS